MFPPPCFSWDEVLVCKFFFSENITLCKNKSKKHCGQSQVFWDYLNVPQCFYYVALLDHSAAGTLSWKQTQGWLHLSNYALGELCLGLHNSTRWAIFHSKQSLIRHIARRENCSLLALFYIHTAPYSTLFFLPMNPPPPPHSPYLSAACDLTALMRRLSTFCHRIKCV